MGRAETIWTAMGPSKRALAPLVVAVVVCVSLGGPAAPAHAQQELTIDLVEVEGSGVSGTATLTAVGAGTNVAMRLAGDAVTGDHPTHIHTGTCESFDPNPTIPLTTVVLDEVNERGISETTVPDVSLSELTSDDYVILVHKSEEELTTYFVCGEIKLAITDMPAGGTGTSAGTTRRAWLPVGLVALAGACLAVALVRWPRRTAG